MASPFPGMDPYIEFCGVWPGFHLKFINYWQEALNDLLPERYEAQIGEDVQLVESLSTQRRRVGPDVAVFQRETPVGSPLVSHGTATLEPVTIPFRVEEEISQPFLQIIDRGDRRLVTVLELLSPSNKDPRGRRLYLAKRQVLYFQDVHLFELDLLLAGDRLPLERELPPGDYYALVTRSNRRPDCDVFAWTVQTNLPVLPVPLSAPDPDVHLDLQAVFALTYERGRYARSLDYSQPVPQTVAEETARWIRSRTNSRSA